MSQDLFKLSAGFNCAPQGEERNTLRLYYKHAATLLRTYDQWKDIDRFYFIPIKLNMAYFCAGWATAVALPPYFIGTILRNSIEHPNLFAAQCECGSKAYGYTYNGSPLSGRFDISLACSCCGQVSHITETGWKIRSETLKETQSEDLKRGQRMRVWHPGFKPATIRDLLRFVGVTEEEMILPPEELKISKHKLGDGKVLVSDSAGGCVVVEE